MLYDTSMGDIFARNSIATEKLLEKPRDTFVRSLKLAQQDAIAQLNKGNMKIPQAKGTGNSGFSVTIRDLIARQNHPNTCSIRRVGS